MGAQADQDRVVERLVAELRFVFEVTGNCIHVAVENRDGRSAFSAMGRVSLQQRIDRGWFREAVNSASVIARDKADALAAKGSFDQDLCSDWNDQSCVQELLRLLKIGIDSDREARGTMRAVDLEASSRDDDLSG